MSNAVYMYVPFERVERKDGECWAEGYAFVNETVPGEGGIRLRRDAMEAATADYMRFGAVREMHGRNAAGTASQITWDEKGARIRAKIVDPVARMKVEEGVYKGFSVGVQPTVTRGKDIYTCTWYETSLVDRPKDPDALFTTRGEGIVLDRVEEAEMLRGHGADCACTGCEIERVKPRVTCPECGCKTNSPTDENCCDCKKPLAENAERCGSEMQHVAEATEERGMTSETAPSRENLEGGKPPKDLLEAAKRVKREKGTDHKKDGVKCPSCGHDDCDCQECKDAQEEPKSEVKADKKERVDGATEEAISRLEAATVLFEDRIERLNADRADLLERAETAETRLAEVCAELSAAKEQVARMQGEAKPVANPVRFPQALSRDFMVNRGNETKATLARLIEEYNTLANETVPKGLTVDEQTERATRISMLKNAIARLS